MMSLWDALRMNMMISYQELVRTFPNATAAISVLSVGATTGVKNRKLVEQLLDEYEG
ncbi:sugar kinase YdjH [Klebsiella pneumoniae]|nr:hypothetical protein [Klebsiella pneumoniae]MCB8869711.1 hypothetical protein [Klebsiella pneumoniae]GKM79774.1 hypothetical protein MS5214_55410 [Klebsiella pneumoniae]SYO65292.1 sugar kinase YdjH [Klebsiella pneumoniae]HBX0133350.1 hypothetical protein [Klebsiella pneumoniae]